MGRRAHSAAVAATPPDRVRPPGGPGPRPREHARGLHAGRAAGRDGPGERRVAHPGRRGGARPRRRGAPGPAASARSPTLRPGRPARATSRPWPSCTPPWAPSSDCRLDVKDPAAFDRTVEVARAAGGGALRAALAVPPPTGSRWPPGGGAAPRCAWSTRPSSGTCRTGPERRAAALARAGIDAVNLHHTEWTGGPHRPLPPLRGPVLRLGRPARPDPRRAARRGIDAVYSDHVDRMVDALRRAADAACRAAAGDRRRSSRACRCRPGARRGRRRGRRCVSIGIGPRYG